MLRHPSTSFLPLLITGLIAAGIILIATRWGIGASPDSVIYIAGARNITAGYGFTLQTGQSGDFLPITRFGPLYSATLAVFSLLGTDPAATARQLSAILFAGFIITAGLIFSRSLPKRKPSSFWGPLLGAMFILATPPFLLIFVMAWSEGLFLVLGLLGSWLLGSHLDKPRSGLFLLGSTTLGLALLTRFAGAAYLVTGFIGLLIFTTGTSRRRVTEALACLVIGALPIGLWLLRNVFLTGSGSDRQFLFHPFGLEKGFEALATLASWFLIPLNAPALIKAIPVLTAAMLITTLVLRRYLRRMVPRTGEEDTAPSTPGVIVLQMLFVPVYGLFLVFSLTFFDANTPLDNRILVPVLLAAVIVSAYWISDLFSPGWQKKPLPLLVAAAAGILWAGYAFQSAGILKAAYLDGLGFNSLAWQQSDTIRQVEALPADTQIFSNAPEAIILHTGRTAYRLPKAFEAVSQRPNPDYLTELENIQESIESGDAVLVYFTRIRAVASSGDADLISQLELTPRVASTDGTIYGNHPVGN